MTRRSIFWGVLVAALLIVVGVVAYQAGEQAADEPAAVVPDSAVPDVDEPGREGSADVPRGYEQTGVIGFAGISSREVRRPIAVARTIQGTVCHGDVKVRRGQLAPRQLGQANYTYYGGPRDWQTYRNCVITITTKQLSPTRLCAVMAHEWGHLRGKAHVSDPTQLMYPRLNARNIPRSCRPE
jgi:hypothetical protein